MRVLVVRNNPNLLGMERLEGLFVRMRFSHPENLIKIFASVTMMRFMDGYQELD